MAIREPAGVSSVIRARNAAHHPGGVRAIAVPLALRNTDCSEGLGSCPRTPGLIPPLPEALPIRATAGVVTMVPTAPACAVDIRRRPFIAHPARSFDHFTLRPPSDDHRQRAAEAF